MKKLAVLFMAVVMTIMTCVACSGGSDEKKSYSFECSDMANALHDGIKYDDELSQTRDAVFFRMYGLEETDVEAQAAFFGTNATTEEIAVAKCKDADAAAKVEEAFKKRIDKQKDVFASYAPDEVSRLEKAIVKKLDNYVILVITGDTDKAESIIDENAK